jgi:hypothetical protein
MVYQQLGCLVFDSDPNPTRQIAHGHVCCSIEIGTRAMSSADIAPRTVASVTINGAKANTCILPAPPPWREVYRQCEKKSKIYQIQNMNIQTVRRARRSQFPITKPAPRIQFALTVFWKLENAT